MQVVSIVSGVPPSHPLGQEKHILSQSNFHGYMTRSELREFKLLYDGGIKPEDISYIEVASKSDKTNAGKDKCGQRSKIERLFGICDKKFPRLKNPKRVNTKRNQGQEVKNQCYVIVTCLLYAQLSFQATCKLEEEDFRPPRLDITQIDP